MNDPTHTSRPLWSDEGAWPREVAGMDGFEHGHADVNGTRLHYVTGGGPAVVLLYGWPLTWAEWRTVMPPLAAAGHTVIAPDLRGSGDSAKPESGYEKTNVARFGRGAGRRGRAGGGLRSFRGVAPRANSWTRASPGSWRR